MSPELGDVCVVDPLVVAQRVGHHPRDKDIEAMAVPGQVIVVSLNQHKKHFTSDVTITSLATSQVFF